MITISGNYPADVVFSIGVFCIVLSSIMLIIGGVLYLRYRRIKYENKRLQTNSTEAVTKLARIAEIVNKPMNSNSTKPSRS